MRQIIICSYSRECKELRKDATITKRRLVIIIIIIFNVKILQKNKSLGFIVFFFFFFSFAEKLFLLNFAHKYLHVICIFTQPIQGNVLYWESSFWLFVLFCFK